MINKKRKKVAVLGSTGSVGTQTLAVIRDLPDDLELTAIAAGSNTEVLNQQVKEFGVSYVGLTNCLAARGLDSGRAEIFLGETALVKIATLPEIDMVVVATCGMVALSATMGALKNNKIVALADKEILVVAGEMIMSLVKFDNQLRTIDSEHSGIWQCLLGEDQAKVKKAILTASGGAFRDYTFERLRSASPEESLKHPNWKMGKQIMVDSATLMNKGFEVMEAHWLFGLSYDQIRVLIHRQSIVHSLVEFIDGSVKSQLAVPDMRLVIQFALMFPERIANGGENIFLDWARVKSLTFESPDLRRFPCLGLGYEVGEMGGTYPAVLVAANEVVVDAFLRKRVGFMDIPVILSKLLERHQSLPITLETIKGTMNRTKQEALCLIGFERGSDRR